MSERAGRYVAAIRWYTRGRRRSGVVGGHARRSCGPARPRQRRHPVAQGHYATSVRGALPAVPAAERVGDATCSPRRTTCCTLRTGISAARRSRATGDLALPIYEELGDLVGQGNVLNNLGIEAYFEGRWDDALDLYRRSRDAKARAGHIANVATQSNNEAEILSDQGGFEEAEALLRDALRVWGRPATSSAWRSPRATSGARGARRAARRGLAPLEEAASRFERIGAGGYVDETRARIAECLALAGRPTRRGGRPPDPRPGPAGAETERPRGAAGTDARLGALLDGVPSAASVHVAASLREARALGAAYEVAVTLETAQPIPGRPGEDVARDQQEVTGILDSLGVVSLPAVPVR